MDIPEIVITMATSHINHVERASTRRLRKMCQDAITEACQKARDQGAIPITMVDDLSAHSFGPWTNAFAKGLARSARREKVSVTGGEMAQMPDTYAPGYAGVVVSLVSIKGR